MVSGKSTIFARMCSKALHHCHSHCLVQVRFAKPLDALLMIVGVLMAIASGLALPGHMLMFGEVIDLFISYDLGRSILAQLNNLTQTTNQSIPLSVILMTLSGMGNNTELPIDVFGTGNASAYFCDLNGTQQQGSNIITFLTANDSSTELQMRIGLYSIYYVAMGAGVLIAAFLATSLMNLSAYRQTRRMRIAFFRSVLKQDIGWFDVNPSAELNNRLSE